MNILYLGPHNTRLYNHLSSIHTVIHSVDPISIQSIEKDNPDFILSYGYRHIISPFVNKKYKGKCVNLHISFLPWNRGADSNLWSIYDETPKGVTIHEIADGLDKGDILIQEEVKLENEDTLKSSYEKLQNKIQDLFIENCDSILNGLIKPKPQEGKGSYHWVKDREKIEHVITNGFDTTISQILCNKLKKI